MPTSPPGEVGDTPAASFPRAASDGKPRLLELAQEIRTCQKCDLHRERTQTVFARGSPDAELCFIGEGPGADEDAQGFPFVGKAGQLLDRMIGAMGLAPADVYICNIVKCRPPANRKPEPAEMSACRPYLREQLELVAPKVLVALGATAVEGLIGMSGGITRIRGQWKLFRNIPLMPTFHPAYLLRNPAAKREVWADLQAVLKQLGRPVPPTGRST
jgi:DNA polymerase